MDKKTLDLLEKTDWKRIHLQLEEYALYKAKRLHWRSGIYRDLPQGKTPKDIAQEAIEKTLAEERNWDPEKQPDILAFLKSVVDSLINHLVQSQNHRKLQPLPENGDGNIREDIVQEWNPNPPLNPEEELLNKEEEERADRIMSMMFDAVAGDADLEIILDARTEGCVKAEEIAETKNMDIKKVYNLIKKLKRKSRKLNIDGWS